METTNEPITTVDATLALALSRVMRVGMCQYDLPEREQRLAQWLILETLEAEPARLVGEVNFKRWAERLGLADGQRLRPDKCQAVFESLQRLRLLNWNREDPRGVWDGTFELLPNPAGWSDMRRRLCVGKDPSAAGQELLPFCARRELDEALASGSRAGALAATCGEQKNGASPVDLALPGQSQGRSVPWDRLRGALDDPRAMEGLAAEFRGHTGDSTGGKSRPSWAEKAAQSVAEKAAQAQAPPDTPLASWAEKAAQPPIISLVPVQRTKLVLAGENSAQPDPDAAWRWLQGVDRRGTLLGRFGDDYRKLCEAMPDYVLSKLRRCFEEHERFYRGRSGPDYRLADPVGWMGAIAAKEGRMRWHRRRE